VKWEDIMAVIRPDAPERSPMRRGHETRRPARNADQRCQRAPFEAPPWVNWLSHMVLEAKQGPLQGGLGQPAQNPRFVSRAECFRRPRSGGHTVAPIRRPRALRDASLVQRCGNEAIKKPGPHDLRQH